MRPILALAPWAALSILTLPVAAQQTWRASVDSSGGEGSASSIDACLSGDARYVCFTSDAPELVPGDTNRSTDAFVHDRVTGVTTRVSVSGTGQEGNGDVGRLPRITPDGRFVVFTSHASNLVPGDGNGRPDIFVRDRVAGTTTRVSVSSAGFEASGNCLLPDISDDGRHVVFQSDAPNLDPADMSIYHDVFLHDRQSGSTVLISRTPAGKAGNDHSLMPRISGDGRFIAFHSSASDLVTGDGNGTVDVFRADRVSGAVELLSATTSGAPGDGPSFVGDLSFDGRRVAFHSFATDLFVGDANGVADVFLWDDTFPFGPVNLLVSRRADGVQADADCKGATLSASGLQVAWFTKSTNLVPGDTNNADDVFRHDFVTGVLDRASVTLLGAEGNDQSVRPSLSGDGKFVAFDSYATNLVPGDGNGAFDVFVHGKSLKLVFDPDVLSPGDLLSLFVVGGQPASPCWLYVTDVNGMPVLVNTLRGRFDGAGRFLFQTVTPSGLAGLRVTHVALGRHPGGRLDVSEPAVVTFQ